MPRYPGKLNTDVYAIQANEMRLAHIQYSAAEMVAADADGLIDGQALGAAAVTLTEFLNDMPYARNVTIVASDAQTGDCVVNGTNLADDVISETLAFNGTTPVVGTKAFKTITSIVLPIKVGSETCDIGWGQLVGLPYMFASKPLVFAQNDGAVDTTPALTVDADELEKNVVDFNGSLDGSVMDLYLAV